MGQSSKDTDMGSLDKGPDKATESLSGTQREKAILMDAECFRKATERGEQTFTLVEHDPTAPKTILHWIKLNWDTAPIEKLRDAFEDALSMKTSTIPKRSAD
jgi:hypothetical protein